MIEKEIGIGTDCKSAPAVPASRSIVPPLPPLHFCRQAGAPALVIFAQLKYEEIESTPLETR